VGIEGETNHCAMALSAEPNTSALFNPQAFTPVELKRMARYQVVRGREIHLLMQVKGGISETTLDFRNADLSGRNVDRNARETGELMELSDGFFFQISAE